MQAKIREHRRLQGISAEYSDFTDFNVQCVKTRMNRKISMQNTVQSTLAPATVTIRVRCNITLTA
jgi:hypothetical protein